MIKFQRNFTTPEQSKHLLDLGLPEDSADCCVENTWDGLMIYVFRGCETYSTIDEDEHPNIQYPCWSAGRLIEIIAICLSAEIVISTNEYPHVLDNILHVIEDCIEEFDFSKLEEQ